MKTFNTMLVFVAGTVMALPTTEKNATFPAKMGSRGHGVCPDFLYSVPSCCSTDVLGILGLDCSTPSSTWNLKSTCASGGKQTLCCSIHLEGLGVLCTEFISD
ncbi:hypothetical protein E4U22_005302 [Claviceps purpurea]|nr:hypothetical protein E4U22_005302 [Claviceps purpurea]